MLSNKEIEKLYKYSTDHKVYCQNCGDGHGYVFNRKESDRAICRNCGHWIYRDEKTKLKYEMKEKGVNIL